MEKYLLEEKNLEKVSNEGDRDTLLIEVAGDNYNRLMKHYADELGGMLGVSDYIANVVDRVLASDEYIEAVQFERDKKGSRWDYMHIKYANCLDWYFLDKANAIIYNDYPRLTEEA